MMRAFFNICSYFYMEKTVSPDQFLFKNCIPSKNERQNFSNKGKILFLSHVLKCFLIFAQREFFIKDPPRCSFSGLPAFKCQRYRIHWLSNQELFHHYQHGNHLVNMLNSSNQL